MVITVLEAVRVGAVITTAIANVPDSETTTKGVVAETIIPAGVIMVVAGKEVVAVDLDESSMVAGVEAGVVEADAVAHKVMANCWI